MVKVKRLKLDDTRRILITSDIHGGIDLLNKLLNKVGFNKKDYLFIVGDIIEKGPDSLKTLKSIYDLCQNTDTYVTLGNNDLLLEDIKNNCNHHKYYNYIKYRNTIYNDFINELGFSKDDILNDKTYKELEKLNKAIYEKYQYLIDFVLDLPVIIETDRLLFCHAGLKDFSNLENNDLEYCLKKIYFLNEDFKSDKLLFVGHFPALGYQKRICSYKPIRSFKKRAICIDGGFSETIEGQINLMVCESESNINLYSLYDDLFNEVEVIKDQEYKQGDLYIWNENKIVIKNECGNYYDCIIDGKKQLKIHKSFFFLYDNTNPDSFTNTDFSTSFLALSKGDKVKLIRKLDDVSYIKYDGVCGFVNNEALDL